jgi:hypothetical protein
MNRIVLFASLALFTTTVACGSDDDGSPRSASSSGGTSTSPTEPAGGGEEKKESAKAELGPSCTAYLACCDELSAENPQLGVGCDQTRTSIDDAQKSGASTSSYESACKSALESMQGMGYCD